MIPSDTAALAIDIANGVIKFAGRLDRLLSEKIAVTSPLVLKLPTVDFSLGPNVIGPRLKDYLSSTSSADPGPLGPQKRQELSELMSSTTQDLSRMRQFFALAFPTEALVQAVTPDANFLQYLRDTMPGLRESLPTNPADSNQQKQATYQAAVLTAAFYTDPGGDNRQLGYSVRVGLLVVDVLAEFGQENTQLFVKDEGLRNVVQAVLERFAKPDLETFDSWSPLLRHVLNSTLNGVLDSRSSWQGTNPWLGALLQALADARDSAGAGGDDYLLGLIQGRGYQALLTESLTQAAKVLDEGDAPAFQQIAADILSAAAPLVKASPTTFGAFFQDHWADLFHAAFVSLDKHGSALLAGQSPLLGQVLLAMVKTLENTPGVELVTSETAFHLANAVIGAFATHEELWKNGIQQTWLNQLIGSVLNTVSDQGIQNAFTKDGLDTILRNAAASFADHPEWIVKAPGLFQDVVGGVLKQVGQLNAFDAKTLAQAGVKGALQAIVDHPELIPTGYAKVIADFAGLLASKVKGNSLSAIQASDILSSAANAALLNPAIFADATKGFPGIITEAVLRAAKGDPAQLLTGTTLVEVVQLLFQTIAQRGAGLLSAHAPAVFGDKLTGLLSAGLARAEIEMGLHLDLATLPATLAALVVTWARGNVAVIDANNSEFQAVFTHLADASFA